MSNNDCIVYVLIFIVGLLVQKCLNEIKRIKFYIKCNMVTLEDLSRHIDVILDTKEVDESIKVIKEVMK